MQAEATIDFSTFDKAKGSDLSLSCLHVQCNLIDNELPCSANDAGLKLLARRSRPELGLAYLGTALATSPSSTDMATPSLDPTDPQAPSTGDLTPSLYRSHRFEEAILPALAETRKRPSFSRAHSAFEATPLREDARPVFDPHYALMQMSLPRQSSDGNPRFYPESYNGHSRHHTASSLASTFGSTSGPYTPDEETNRYSWTTASSRSNDMEASMQQLGHGSKKTESRSQLADLASSNAGLMGDAHFGPAVREKVAEAVAGLMQGVSMSGEEDEVLTLCEYGALNSRSVSLMPDLIKPLAARQPSASFYMVHADSPQVNFRPLSAELELPDAYLSEGWQSRCDPPLTDRIFSAYSARPRASSILPSSTVSAGLSLFDLHWAQASSATESAASVATRELDTFLRARAKEFRSGGLLVMAFIQRSEDTMTGSRPVSIGNERDALDCFAPPASHTSLLTSPSPSFAAHRHGIMQRRRSGSSPSRPTFALRSTPRRDLWSALTRTLAPCIQRLVSCGMIKSDVARDLLTLPDRFHPRTPRQTVAVLRGRSGEWEIEYAAGLSDALGAGSSTPRAAASNQEAKLPTLEETLTLVHPACKALQAGQMGAKIYAEHCIQFVKTLYESHFKTVLAKGGKFSRSATEYIVEQLFDILREKVEEGELGMIELEVTVVALRRK